MSQIGLKHRLSVANTFKQETRALYEGVLGATVTSPRPDVEIFTFANGSGIGVFYVDPGKVLTPEQHLRSIWLEFEVEDEKTTAAKLEALGMRPFEYSTRRTSTSRRLVDKSSVSPNTRRRRPPEWRKK